MRTLLKMNRLSGNCECRKVSFEINQEIKYFSYCHCSQCRRSHGSAFASFIEVEKSFFKYKSGIQNTKTYASSQDCERVFSDATMNLSISFHGENTLVSSLWDLQLEQQKIPAFEDVFND